MEKQARSSYLMLLVYVPEDHVEAVKLALFQAGAGRLGQYEHCCWQVAGQGQFKALAGSQPFTGEKGVLERVAEMRVEMICAKAVLAEVVAALKRVHPYETPAFSILPMLDIHEI
jgi:hypothetical protein